MTTLNFELPPMVARMEAKGKVVNPDGSSFDIKLVAEKPIGQEKESGDNSSGSRPNSGD